MRSLHSGAIAIICLFGWISANALECVVYEDFGNLLGVGSAQVGENIKNIPTNAKRSPGCFEDLSEGYIDCEYTDERGVTYAVAGGTIHKVEVKNLAKFGGNTIARVAYGDSLMEVLRKLRSLPSYFPPWYVGALTSGGFYLTTDTCIRGSMGVTWSYGLQFDEAGSLTGIDNFILLN
jgi:hypothetical protein